MRITLEASQHGANCFTTLTYDDDHLPEDRSLDKTHLRQFFDRLRKKKGPFRYYACGEYGDLTQRAHYHACLFGMDFADKVEFQDTPNGMLYISEELRKLWGHGNVSIAELNFETAAYTARYVLKKKRGLALKAPQHCRLEEKTGELIPILQPFAVMSLGTREKGTAIGGTWLRKYGSDIYKLEKDSLVMRGQHMKPPKYFDKLYDTINPDRLKQIKEKRKENHEELTLDQKRVRETITRARLLKKTKV